MVKKICRSRYKKKFYQLIMKIIPKYLDICFVGSNNKLIYKPKHVLKTKMECLASISHQKYLKNLKFSLAYKISTNFSKCHKLKDQNYKWYANIWRQRVKQTNKNLIQILNFNFQLCLFLVVVLSVSFVFTYQKLSHQMLKLNLL